MEERTFLTADKSLDWSLYTCWRSVETDYPPKDDTYLVLLIRQNPDGTEELLHDTMRFTAENGWDYSGDDYLYEWRTYK